jgi:hypothetical protein
MNLVIQQFLRNYVAVDQQDWVDHLELAEFCYNNSEHSATSSIPFQMVMGKSPIVPTTWAAHGQPSNDVNEEVPMVTQLDEERQCLWEMVKANLEKVHKRYKDFVNKSRPKVSFEKVDDVVEHKKFQVARRFKSQVLGPICRSIQSVGKKIP